MQRDAIVLSGWNWESFGAPERISLALAQLGCKVLHCVPPASVFRSKPVPIEEVRPGIHSLKLRFVGSRLNALPGVPNLQAAMLRRQMICAAKQLGLRNPLFFYVWLGELFPLCAQMKRDHFVIHLCMDHSVSIDPHYERFVEVSDQTLAIPRSSYHKFKAKFGAKVESIPQAVDFTGLTHPANDLGSDATEFCDIPRPRLGYLSAPRKVLNLELLHALLNTHPEWHFVSMGPEKAVGLANAHTLPWTRPEGLGSYLRSFDVGFMPYNCYDEERLHIVPLKVFDYFAFGLPVVSTPLIHMWQYKDLIYFGDTAEELAAAIKKAISEPPDSPKRAARREVAKAHSLENLAIRLRELLPLGESSELNNEEVDSALVVQETA